MEDGARLWALRVAAGVAVVAAAVAMGLVVGGSEATYTIHARFENSSQLVKGDLVQVAGREVGQVVDVDLAPEGHAELTVVLDDDVAPIRRDTRLVVRLRSLLGVANRYIDLQPGAARGAKVPAGGLVSTDQTRSTVDFDAVLDLIGPRERESVKRVVAGSSRVFRGRGQQANEGLMYLAPFLSTTNGVVDELQRDRPGLRRLVVRGADLTSDVASRRRSLEQLIGHLSQTGTALARQDDSLRGGLRQLPVFLERGDRTFRRLQTSLRTLRPLVRESRPAVRRLSPFLADLRAFARGARPTVRDLALTVRRPGAGNDLKDLLDTAVPLRAIATRSVRANGKVRPGAFPVTTSALRQSTPLFASARPYAVDLTGWFNDFGTSGVYDANGGISRSSTTAGAFQALDGTLYPLPPELRAKAFQATASLGNTRRCPGSDERDPGDGSTPFVDVGVECDRRSVPPGP